MFRQTKRNSIRIVTIIFTITIISINLISCSGKEDNGETSETVTTIKNTIQETTTQIETTTKNLKETRASFECDIDSRFPTKETDEIIQANPDIFFVFITYYKDGHYQEATKGRLCNVDKLTALKCSDGGIYLVTGYQENKALDCFDVFANEKLKKGLTVVSSVEGTKYMASYLFQEGTLKDCDKSNIMSVFNEYRISQKPTTSNYGYSISYNSILEFDNTYREVIFDYALQIITEKK